MSKFTTGHITGIISSQSVIVNGMPCHEGDVHLWLSSGLLVDGGSNASPENNGWWEPSTHTRSSSTLESEREVLTPEILHI